MKKGRIVNINQLPKITIQDENKKVKVVELAGVLIPTLENFHGDLAAHATLRKYLYHPIEYQLAKGTTKAKIWIPGENKNLS